MLVRILELNFTNNDSEGMDNAHYLAGYEFENIDKIIEFVKSMKGKDLRINDEYYTIEDWIWNFPQDFDSLSCLDIYVLSY